MNIVSKVFVEAIASSNMILRKIFGLEWVMLPASYNISHSDTIAQKKSSLRKKQVEYYMCQNILRSKSIHELDLGEFGLLSYIICVISIGGNSIRHGDMLFLFSKYLSIDLDNVEYRRMLNEWIKRKYLLKDTDKEDEKMSQYRLGARGQSEFRLEQTNTIIGEVSGENNFRLTFQVE